MTYVAPLGDIEFLLRQVFDFDIQICSLPGFDDVNTDVAVSVLTEASRFCADRIEPLNRVGDQEGCRLTSGAVITPPGFSTTYRDFAQAGWTALSGSPEFGGQGLPTVLQLLLDEMLAAANLSFGLFAGLTRGAESPPASR